MDVRRCIALLLLAMAILTVGGMTAEGVGAPNRAYAFVDVTGHLYDASTGTTIRSGSGVPFCLGYRTYIYGADAGLSGDLLVDASGMYHASSYTDIWLTLLVRSYDASRYHPAYSGSAPTLAEATAMWASGWSAVGPDFILNPVGTASISGRAVSPSGAGVPGLRVEAQQRVPGIGVWDPVEIVTTTGPDGGYTIGTLGAGSYVVRFWDPAQAVCLPGYNGSSAEASDAPVVNVQPGQAVAAVDTTVTETGDIGGYVRTPGAAPLPGALVTLYGMTGATWSAVATTSSDAEGKWHVRLANAGAYRVGASDPSGRFQPSFHGGATVDDATDVPSVLGTRTCDADVTLRIDHAASVHGFVDENPTGVPLEGVPVKATAYTATFPGGYVAAEATTGADGGYVLDGLPAASYALEFGGSAKHFPRWYANADSAGGAQRLVLSADEVTTGVDVALDTRSSISGHALDLDVPLEVVHIVLQKRSADGSYADVGWGFASKDYPDFAFEDVRPGTYRLHCEAGGSYQEVFYHDARWASAATPLVIGESTQVAGITQSIQHTSNLAGSAHNAAGDALSNVEAAPYYQNELGQWVRHEGRVTDFGGGFAFGLPVHSGVYRVQFNDLSGKYVSAWYGGGASVEEAADVVCPSGGYGYANVVMHLAHPAHLKGRVTAARDGASLGGIVVRASIVDYQYHRARSIAETVTSADGSYDLTDLDTGNYTVTFIDKSGTYRGENFPHVGVPVGWAPYIPVALGQTVTGIDAHLVRTADLTAADRVVRIEGPNRYRTALEVSRRNFLSVNTAVLVTGEGFADAVSASPLAGAYGSPVLLTPARGVPDGLIAELLRLKTKKVIIVGGEAAVSELVRFQLESAGLTVDRIRGADRYETAANVSGYLLDQGFDVAKEPFVVRGDMFPDALSASSVAWYDIRPILLTRPTAAPASTVAALRRLGTDTVVVVGGTSSVGISALRDLAAGTPEGIVYYARIYGADRYATSAEMAKVWGPMDFLGLATGANFPDALGGGAVCGGHRAGILLTPSTTLHPAVSAVIKSNAQYLWLLQVFGSNKAVSDGVFRSVGSVVGSSVYKVSSLSTSVRPTAGEEFNVNGEIRRRIAVTPSAGFSLQTAVVR